LFPRGRPRLLALLTCLAALALPASAGAQHTSWNPLPRIDSRVEPSLLAVGTPSLQFGNLDGRIFAAAVSDRGYVALTSTTTPTGWQDWQIVGPEPAAGPVELGMAPMIAAPDTPPVLLESGGFLHLFARGADDGLHVARCPGRCESMTNWSLWAPVLPAGEVAGRFQVAGTARTGSGWSVRDIHLVYRSVDLAGGPVVVYRRLDETVRPQGAGRIWRGAVEASVGTDALDRVVVAVHVAGEGLELEVSRRASHGWTPFERLWSWREVPRGITGLSNVAFQGRRFHVAWFERRLRDDVSMQTGQDLAHVALAPERPETAIRRTIAHVGEDPLPLGVRLVVYRQRLVAGFRVGGGGVGSAWLDDSTPDDIWVDGGRIGSITTGGRPALTVFERCRDLRGAGCDQPGFGNDIVAAVHQPRAPEAINLSRTLIQARLRDLGTRVRWCTEYQGDRSMPKCPAVAGLPAASELPIVSEVGAASMLLPDRVMKAMAAVYPGGGPTTWLHTQSVGAAWIGPGLNIDPRTSGRTWLHEFGHGLDGMLGLCDDCPQPGPNQLASLFPSTAVADAFGLFGQRVNGDCTNNTPDDTCPDVRIRGFTRDTDGLNYEVSSRQHSFIATMIRSRLKGETTRGWVANDLAAGDRLLHAKYGWMREYMFGGREFDDRGEAIADQDPLALRWSWTGPIWDVTGETECVQVTESRETDPGWQDNYLCTRRDAGLRWSSAGPIAGMRCAQVHEAREVPGATWSDNYACLPSDSPWRLSYASNGPIPGQRCTALVEPADPHSWADNYLCYDDAS